MNYKLGCIPSKKDNKDFISSAIIPQDSDLENYFSWRDKDPLIINQGNHGTCVGCASAGIKNIHEIVEGDFVEDGYSPLFIYTLCKKLDGIPDIQGTYPRIAMQVLNTWGVCPEKDLPYSLLKDFKNLPTITQEQVNISKKYKIETYASVPINIDALKQAIKISPVLVGAYVTDGFYKARNDGFVFSPSGYNYGGHAIKFIEWDDDLTHSYDGKIKKGFFVFANTWGSGWGDSGYGYIAYEDINCMIKNIDIPFIYEAWSCVDMITKKDEGYKKYWKVQLFAFKEKTNAYKAVEKLKSQGFSTYIPPKDEDGFYRIQVGAFNQKENAEKLANKLRELGYKPWVRFI